MDSWKLFEQWGKKNGVVTEGDALSMCRWSDSDCIGVVRPTVKGEFAVIACMGEKGCRVVKVLPTLDRARAYNLSCR